MLVERTAGKFWEICCRWPDAGQKIACECNVFRISKKIWKSQTCLLKCDLFVSKRRSKDLLDKILFFITLNYFWHCLRADIKIPFTRWNQNSHRI